MKTNYLKRSLLIVAMAVTTTTYAQKKAKVDAGDYEYSNYDQTIIRNGKQLEQIKTNWNGTIYKIELVKDKMTDLYVDGEKIPVARWGEYSTVVGKIREQIRKDRIQAKKDQAQALVDQAQARRDQQQALKDQAQAKRDQEQAVRDQEQAKRDQQQAEKDQAEAKEGQVQAQKDQEQALRDQEQAKKDQEQARLDQIQAKKDQAQAAEDQRQVKLLTADLVKDGIIPNADALHELTLNDEEMTVNGKKQPDTVFNKYKGKYNRFTKLNFSYGNSNGVHTYQGLHISH
ncbi:DUF4407 domain-containing protein [Mucilaginibacter dorajii]|uniref:Uncharacterized protein n=1 Tax=Mucilaginibacter dorajii TaxID=692994 RepID=A0ABP7PSY7_9SPHI|nr:DUF4407 domain-containing protein [Mucilaginibacter dorajii]MCS3736809.1 flagellar biosynthesis GTPase FlhF [Mucilaginibacter dorajii]